MRLSSALVTSLAQSISPGEGLEVPELLLPTIELPLPLAATGASGLLQDLRNGVSSAGGVGTVNQPINTAATTVDVFILGKGLWRFTGQLVSLTSAILGTPAGPFVGFASLIVPGGAGGFFLALTGTTVSAGDMKSQSFDVTVNLTQDGWVFRTGSFLNTGPAQTIGTSCSVLASRLI